MYEMPDKNFREEFEKKCISSSSFYRLFFALNTAQTFTKNIYPSLYLKSNAAEHTQSL